MEKLKNSIKNIMYLFICCIVIIIAISVLYALLIKTYIGTSEAQGQFGDMFGALNTIFSGCAFAGVLLTILFQHVEIAKQKKEMENQRLETAKRDFERVFYDLLKIHINNLHALYIPARVFKDNRLISYFGHDYSGLICLKILREVFNIYNRNAELYNNFLPKEEKDRYNHFYKAFKDHTEIIHKNIYSILNIIYECKDLEKSEKEYYVQLLIDQISINEIYLIDLDISYREIRGNIKTAVKMYHHYFDNEIISR